MKKMKVVCHINGEQKSLQIDVTDTYDGFMQRLASSFGLGKKQWTLKYQEENNVLYQLEDDEDYQQMIIYYNEQSNSAPIILKISISDEIGSCSESTIRPREQHTDQQQDSGDLPQYQKQDSEQIDMPQQEQQNQREQEQQEQNEQQEQSEQKQQNQSEQQQEQKEQQSNQKEQQQEQSQQKKDQKEQGQKQKKSEQQNLKQPKISDQKIEKKENQEQQSQNEKELENNQIIQMQDSDQNQINKSRNQSNESSEQNQQAYKVQNVNEGSKGPINKGVLEAEGETLIEDKTNGIPVFAAKPQVVHSSDTSNIQHKEQQSQSDNMTDKQFERLERSLNESSKQFDQHSSQQQIGLNIVQNTKITDPIADKQKQLLSQKYKQAQMALRVNESALKCQQQQSKIIFKILQNTQDPNSTIYHLHSQLSQSQQAHQNYQEQKGTDRISQSDRERIQEKDCNKIGKAPFDKNPQNFCSFCQKQSDNILFLRAFHDIRECESCQGKWEISSRKSRTSSPSKDNNLYRKSDQPGLNCSFCGGIFQILFTRGSFDIHSCDACTQNWAFNPVSKILYFNSSLYAFGANARLA